MKKSYEEFFLSLKEPNFLAMKLLLGIFNRFEKDDYSRRIVENISVLSQFDIRLIYSQEVFCYLDFYDNPKRIDFAINAFGTESLACHEFGHLLLKVLSKGEIPKEFLQVNNKCKKRLLNKKIFVSELLQKYRDKAYDVLTKDIDEPLSFYDKHQELKDEYYERFPDGNEDEMIEEKLEEHYALCSAFDEGIANYNKVSNIIDAIFCGRNPFFIDYGKETIKCVLAMHEDSYFREMQYGKYIVSFEEQFADYLVLRTFPDEMKEATQVLHNLLGDEWFTMMDKFYDKVTSRIIPKGKVYQCK